MDPPSVGTIMLVVGTIVKAWLAMDAMMESGIGEECRRHRGAQGGRTVSGCARFGKEKKEMKRSRNGGCVFAMAVLAAAMSAQAATYTYDAGGSNVTLWSDANNWQGNTLPAFNNQADLVFDTNIGVNGMRIGANRIVRSITFGSGLYGQNGNQLIIQTLADTGTGTRTLTFAAGSGNASFTVESGFGSSNALARLGDPSGGNVILNSDLDLFMNDTTATFQFWGFHSGAGAVNKYGAGRAAFMRANTFSGGVNIFDGAVDAYATPAALGTGAVTLGGAGANPVSLRFGSTQTYANAITVNAGSGARTIGNLGSQAGNPALAGAITLDNPLVVDVARYTIGTHDRMALDGEIGGTGGIVKTGDGVLTMGGTQRFTGDLTLQEGILEPRPGGLHLAGRLVFAGGGLQFNPGVTIHAAGGVSFEVPFGIDNLAGIGRRIAAGTYTLVSGAVDGSNLQNIGLRGAKVIGPGKWAYFEQPNGGLRMTVADSPLSLHWAGFDNGRPSLILDGPVAAEFTVGASTNLVDWEDAGTATLAHAPSVWTDPAQPVGPRRFYRLRMPDPLPERFADPPNEYRLVQYQLNENTLEKYPEYGIGGFTGFFYKELYREGAGAAAKIGPVVDAAQELDMKVWLADDFGYPSGMAGGRVVAENPEYEVRGLAMVTVDGAGQVPAVCTLPAGAERFVAAVLYPLVDGEPGFFQGVEVPVGEQLVETTGLPGSWRLCAFVTVIRDTDVQAQSTAPQFGHTGRYPDLLNPDAVDRFLANMHEPILAHIVAPASKVDGFYANEPNLMQLHWKTQYDALFACAPWNAELPARFRQMHGYGLVPVLGALYGGDGIAARRVRMHFQQTVAEMLAGNFSGRIREWCNARGIRSSGHFLLNHHPSMHVACYGDLMKFCAGFDLPGLDIGIPNPDTFREFHYELMRFFSSIASWKQVDEVIVLLDAIIHGGGGERLSPALPLLHNSANMAFFHGANLLTSYLSLDPVDTVDSYGRPRKGDGYEPEDFRAFNEYVGRISLLLRGARSEAEVALYNPVAMFQADYRPSRQHWSKIVPLHQEREDHWREIQQGLLDAGHDYQIVHPEAVADAEIRDGTLRIGSGSYRYLVMPQMEIVPRDVFAKLRAFEAEGGTVLWVDKKPLFGAYAHEDADVSQWAAGITTFTAEELPGQIGRSYPASFDLLFEPGVFDLPVARFRKDGRRIYYLVNRAEETLTARISAMRTGTVTLLDPATGAVSEAVLPVDVPIQAYNSLLVMD